jgi:hypothetical protein
MRRIALALVLGGALLLLGACTSWNWSDPFHPRVCPKVETCAPTCAPVNMR